MARVYRQIPILGTGEGCVLGTYKCRLRQERPKWHWHCKLSPASSHGVAACSRQASLLRRISQSCATKRAGLAYSCGRLSSVGGLEPGIPVGADTRSRIASPDLRNHATCHTVHRTTALSLTVTPVDHGAPRGVQLIISSTAATPELARLRRKPQAKMTQRLSLNIALERHS